MAPSPPRSDTASLGFGLGLRREHYVAATTGGAAIDDIDWFEVITENFLVEGGNPRRVLRTVREHRPIVLHGVSLSIGSLDPLDIAYLDGVRALARELSPAFISDHLCWTSLGGHNTHDLLPLPYTEEALDHVAARVLRVQEHLGRRILLENPSSYAAFAGATLTEAAFLAELALRASCGLLLDINNAFGRCATHVCAAAAYLYPPPADLLTTRRLSTAGELEIIRSGSPGTGMAAFGRSLPDHHLLAVTRYIRWLRENPPAPPEEEKG